MKTFLEYLLEKKQTITEASFTNKDFFKKRDNPYFEQVINFIKSNDYIIIGSNDSDLQKIKLPNEVKEKIIHFANSLGDRIKYPNEDDLKTFNTLLADKNIPLIKTPLGKNKTIGWTSLYKGQFSEKGTNLISSQFAKKAEAATAFCYNMLVNNVNIIEADEKDDKEEIEKIIDTTLENEGFNENYIESSKLSAKKIILNTYNSKNMEAAHIDGNDISEISLDSKNIAKMFNSKENLALILSGIIDKNIADQLYKQNKDDWNKADIILVNKHLDIIKQANEWKLKHGFDSVNSLNEFLNTLIIEDDIKPISLKAIDKAKSKTINDVKFILDGFLSSNDENPTNFIKDVEIILSKFVQNPFKSIFATNLTLRATCDNYADLEIVFRNKGYSRALLITAIDKNSKSQGGSAVEKLKTGLELGDSFLNNVELNSLNEFEDKVRHLIDQTFIIPTKLREQIASITDEKLKNSWVDRTAYKAFIAILNGYSNKFENNGKIDKIKFFKYIFDLAVGKDSESIWWLVK